ncbi:HDIG domain-containing metalloprotein [Lyngbya aestuarii]|uniref:HDIG domain-containing metalloprotein n=1 Tax=Lyngbya aestuarii TaxID=118322 RepID=UPI00403E0831
MKTLHSLTEPITQLRRKSEHLRAWLSFGGTNSSPSDNSENNETPKGHLSKRYLRSIISPKQGKSPPRQLSKRKKRPALMWVVAVVSLTGVMGDRFYDQPKLDVGTRAPQKIVAPSDARVEDSKTTEEKRKSVRAGLFPVLMIDKSLTHKITQDLQQSLDKTEELRQISGSFPFVETTALSDSTQRYLRQTKESELQAILALAQQEPNIKGWELPVVLPNQIEEQKNILFAQAVSELQSYRQLSSSGDFAHLIDSVSLARQNYRKALRQLREEIQELAPELGNQSEHPYDASLLELSDQIWQETRTGITETSKRILTQGIPEGLPPQVLEQAVEVQLSVNVPPETKPLATELLVGVLKPNLREDIEQTKSRAEQAALAVDPVMVSVLAGEVIVEAGETITQENFVLLDHFDLSRRGINWAGLIGFGGVVTSAVGIFWLVERRAHPGLRRRDQILILLLTLSTPVLVSFGISYTSLPAIGLLIGSFYGSALGVAVVTLLTGLVGISMEIKGVAFIAGAAGGLLGALMAGRLRSREELALLGVGVGLTEGVIYLILSLMISAPAGYIWYTVLREAVLYGFAGLSWSIVALGLSPYLERVFDLVTPIRLAELSNPNRPLLKRLATEAPGTFQHTLFVASLAEAAARELSCNVELVRAGTLYHDIGKMHDPLGFIENQMGGPNKHDEINDPCKSAEIIKKHVSEGLVMARKHQLPKAIRNFIPEHQGKLLISYFYFQAKQKAELEGTSLVQESDFRYDGPIPQSRETGVVMLADACEAALRSLQDVTPETVLSMVKKILKARWQDNQLVDSGLTREDLSIIAEVFVKVWQQYNHKRIAYPQGAFNCQSSGKS